MGLIKRQDGYIVDYIVVYIVVYTENEKEIENVINKRTINDEIHCLFDDALDSRETVNKLLGYKEKLIEIQREYEDSKNESAIIKLQEILQDYIIKYPGHTRWEKRGYYILIHLIEGLKKIYD